MPLWKPHLFFLLVSVPSCFRLLRVSASIPARSSAGLFPFCLCSFFTRRPSLPPLPQSLITASLLTVFQQHLPLSPHDEEDQPWFLPPSTNSHRDSRGKRMRQAGRQRARQHGALHAPPQTSACELVTQQTRHTSHTDSLPSPLSPLSPPPPSPSQL